MRTKNLHSLQGGALAAILLAGTLTLRADNNDIPAPPDGCGIKWSTLMPVTRPVRLANGRTVQEQEWWDPYNSGVRYFKWKVDLERAVQVGNVRTNMIFVYVLPQQPPAGISAAIRRDWANYQSWCHGLSFGNQIYNPGGYYVPFILAAGYTQVRCDMLQQGDIMVYYSTGRNPVLGSPGSVVHTMISNGNGTFTSKDRFLPVVANQTKAAVDQQYGAGNTVVECFRCRPSENKEERK